MMRSISTKLILAFLSIGIVSVAVILFTARWNTRREFISFLSDQNQTSILASLTAYHVQNGSWDGVEYLFVQTNDRDDRQAPGMGMGPSPHMVMMQPFTLADRYGIVIVSNGRYLAGEKIPKEELDRGEVIIENGEVIGILVPLGVPYQGNPRELEFINRTNLTLIYGALIGAVIALLLGIFLSRTLARPIRELTRATHAVSQGNLLQQVTVRSNDELGELAQAFNKMSAELSRSVNARKQMTADIAHELRTPLSLILGHAEAVHDGVLPPTRENFEIIRDEAMRLEHLVNDLRTLSLADAGELSMTIQPVEPDRLVNEAAARYQVESQKKNIVLALEIDLPLPSMKADPGRITQVLTNILDNALRHTPEGGIIILSAKQTDQHIEIAVQDGGPGVPPEDLERIFERFYRVDSSRQRGGELSGGTGLGLAIAKSIVQAHDGQIWAESVAGKGLRIVISLPKKP